MKAILLAGGIGKRMFPMTEDKWSLKFLGMALLVHQIDLLRKAGLNDFVVIGNPQNINQIKKLAENISGIKIQFVLQPQPLGIADALIKAKPFLDEEVLIQSTSDLVDGSAYLALLSARKQERAFSYILACQVKDYFPGGYLVVDENDKLKEIVEKPGMGNEPSNLVNILVHLHTEPQKIIEHARRIQTTRDDVYERSLDAAIKEGNVVKAILYSGPWTPIKYPWHILNVVRHFLDQSSFYISASAYISDSAIIQGKVIIEDNVKVLERAVVKGPVYIGAGSVVGDGSLVRDYTHIGAGTVVGYSTEIKGSYIGDNCFFHHCYIGDSIIGDGCSFGFGTVLSNLRFDEKNIQIKIGDELVDTGRNKLGAIVGSHSKVGVNVSVMPGVRIGPRSIVGPQVCLTKDLGPGKMALLVDGRVMVKDICVA